MGLQAPKSLDISHRRKNASLLPFNLHLLEVHIAHMAFSSAISNWNLPFNPCFLCMLKLKGSTQCFQASTHLQCLQRSHGKCHARWWGISSWGAEPVPHMWPIWATIWGLLPRPTQNHWPFQAGDTQIQLLGPALLQSRVPIMDLAWEVSWTCHLPAVPEAMDQELHGHWPTLLWDLASRGGTMRCRLTPRPWPTTRPCRLTQKCWYEKMWVEEIFCMWFRQCGFAVCCGEHPSEHYSAFASTQCFSDMQAMKHDMPTLLSTCFFTTDSSVTWMHEICMEVQRRFPGCTYKTNCQEYHCICPWNAEL